MSPSALRWTRVCAVGELADQQARRVQVEDQVIALFNVQGKYFALRDRCPHGNASLSEGWIEDGEVECPLHQARFDIATGRVMCAPARENVCTYAVKVEAQAVLIGLGSNTLQLA